MENRSIKASKKQEVLLQFLEFLIGLFLDIILFLNQNITSEHSNFNELREFVNWLQPVEIIPTVDCETPEKVKVSHSNLILCLISLLF